MKVLIPRPITPTVTALEYGPAYYNNSQAYVIGNLVYINGMAYTCVSDSTGNPPPNNTYWDFIGDSPAPLYVAGHSYIDGDLVTYSGNTYSAINNTTGNLPTNGSFWVHAGPDNKGAISDETISSQTLNYIGQDIVLEIAIPSITSLVLLNIQAASVSIIQNHAIDGEVLNETIQVTQDGGSIDSVFIYNLIPYPSSTIILTVSPLPETQVKIGEVVAGTLLFIGDEAPSIGFELMDYSVKEADTFGNFKIINRNFSKKISATCVTYVSSLTSIVKTLAEFRAKPLVWVATESSFFESAYTTFGFYKRLDIDIDNRIYAQISVEVEGLV